MKAVLEAALASRDAVFDRSRLKQRERVATPLPADEVVAVAEVEEAANEGNVPFILSVPRARTEPAPAPGVRPVPDVRGMSARSAANALHRAGFRVRVVRGGSRGATVPAAGSAARAGTLVSLQFGS
jgi:hypothetical protein